MPDVYRKKYQENRLPKGVSNRNKALHWIFRHAVDKAVVYFADDDNTYDLRLFHEVYIVIDELSKIGISRTGSAMD